MCTHDLLPSACQTVQDINRLLCVHRHIYVEGNQMVQKETYICGRKPDGPGGSRVCTDIYMWKETRWSRWLSCVHRHIYVEGNQMVQVALVCVQTYICGRKPDGPGGSRVCTDIYM